MVTKKKQLENLSSFIFLYLIFSTWNFILTRILADLENVAKYFKEMQNLKIEPDTSTLNTLLEAYGRNVQFPVTLPLILSGWPSNHDQNFPRTFSHHFTQPSNFQHHDEPLR